MKRSAKEVQQTTQLEQLYEEFFDENGGERIRLFYHESIDRMVPATGGVL